MGSDIIQFLKAKAYRKIRDLGHGATGQTVLLHDDSIDEDFVCKKYVPCDELYSIFFGCIVTIPLSHCRLLTLTPVDR